MNNLIKMDKVFKYYYNGDEVQFLDVPYSTVVEKINSVDFREYIIVDIRSEETNLIFDDFHKFQRDFLADKFFYKRNNNPTDGFSMTLYFLEDKENNNICNKNKILDDYSYALKQFITEEDLPNILTKKDKNIILPEITRVVPFRERQIEFNIWC